MSKLIETFIEGYFTPKSWEPRLYERLVVRSVHSILMNTPLSKKVRSLEGIKIPHYILDNPTLEGAQRFERWSRFNEIAHDISFISLGIVLVSYVVSGDLIRTGIGFSVEIMNAGLIMLQRYNRDRISRISERAKRIRGM